MTYLEDIPALMDRIAHAERERDRWQASGEYEELQSAAARVATLESALDERLR